MNKIGNITSVWPLGEGAAKPGIEWPKGTQLTLANHGSLFHKLTKCFILLGGVYPPCIPPSPRGNATYRLSNNYFFAKVI